MPFSAVFETLKNNVNTGYFFCRILVRCDVFILRNHYTAQETVMFFLTFLEILWLLLCYCYIYHHITCDSTGKVAREVGEIGPWRFFSYFVSWMLESKFKLHKRKWLRITDELGCVKIAPLKVYNSVCRNQPLQWK